MGAAPQLVRWVRFGINVGVFNGLVRHSASGNSVKNQAEGAFGHQEVARLAACGIIVRTRRAELRAADSLVAVSWVWKGSSLPDAASLSKAIWLFASQEGIRLLQPR